MRRPLLVFACLALGACVTTPPDPSVFESAERAFEAAERAGAEELSPTELKFARDRLDLARIAFEKSKYDEALLAIEQSEINAELAIEKSRAARERRRVNELRRSNELLREELIELYGSEFAQ
jgi:G:T/U-mismatch repair DNA glycosylase